MSFTILGVKTYIYKPSGQREIQTNVLALKIKIYDLRNVMEIRYAQNVLP